MAYGELRYQTCHDYLQVEKAQTKLMILHQAVAVISSLESQVRGVYTVVVLLVLFYLQHYVTRKSPFQSGSKQANFVEYIPGDISGTRGCIDEGPSPQ
jgi:hypothetical protein